MPSFLEKAAQQQKAVAPKVLGSFAKGGKVPKTGLYKLHSGEFVVKKANAQKVMSMMKDMKMKK